LPWATEGSPSSTCPITIVYNGEIFNYIELRQELEGAGYAFRTRSDTEVILASYARWGADCTSRFNGDWAFCIYDKVKEVLFLSRDRYGVRFLYYLHNGDMFAFGSEIKALLTLPGTGRGLEEKGLSEFVMLGLIDHTDRTFYRDIRQLQPAHNLIFDIRSRSLTVSPYYTLRFNDTLGTYDAGKAGTMAHEINELLFDSVRIRLRSDVPVGSCLSGGLDSSTIVMMINRLIKEEGISHAQVGEHQKTFTASYLNDPVDETAYAKEIISKANVDGRFVFPEGPRFWEEFDRVLAMQDEPFGSTSIYAQWNVMGLARTQVKVVLDGQGGDELFGGYLAHLPFAIAQGNTKLFFERFSDSRIAALRDLYLALGIRYLPEKWKAKSFSLLRRKYFRHLKEVFPQFGVPLWNVEEVVSAVVKPDLNARLFLDMTRYTIPQLLHYEDRNGMAFSIESRVPYLDYRLVDYVMDIPAIYKIYNGWTKWIFRLAVKDLLPPNILWRKDKIGFTTPEKKWLLAGDNPFKSFIEKHGINYDGDYFWWRLFVTSYWMQQRGLST
jgi:asparagine synthase (glutamine-hydrolysing)